MDVRKLIAVDLDGTLLNIDSKVSDKTKTYLKELKNKGHIIVIATGRILSSAIDVTGNAEFANYVVSNTGSLIYDMNTKKIIEEMVISKETIRKICFCYDDDIEYIEMGDSNYYHKYTNKNYSESIFSKIIKNIDEFIINKNVYHISIAMNNNLDKMFEFLSQFDDIKLYYMQNSFSNRKWIDILPQGG